MDEEEEWDGKVQQAEREHEQHDFLERDTERKRESVVNVL